jgi:hypothetical protein
MCIDVLSNFASFDESSDAGKGAGSTSDSIPMIILKELGVAELMASIKNFNNHIEITKGALNALANLCFNKEVCSILVKRLNVIQVARKIYSSHDSSPEIVSAVVNFFSSCARYPDVAKMVALEDGFGILLGALDVLEDDPRSLQVCISAVSVLVGNVEDGNASFVDSDGFKQVLKLLDSHPDIRPLIQETFRLLIRVVAGSPGSCEEFGKADGVRIVLSLLEIRVGDAEVLMQSFKLLSLVSCIPKNMQMIVQFNGIDKIINGVLAHQTNAPLMLQTLRTLETIALANRENTQIVIEQGGRDVMEVIIQEFPDDADIQAAGKSALLSMSVFGAVASLFGGGTLKDTRLRAKQAMKNAIAANSSAQVEDVDPLDEYRKMLTSGKIMQIWERGSHKSAHLVVLPDFRTIVYQELVTQKKLGSIEVRNVHHVRQGMRDNHKKTLLGKGATAACCFSILTTKGSSLDLEATTAKDANAWVKALSVLCETAQKNPNALAPPSSK